MTDFVCAEDDVNLRVSTGFVSRDWQRVQETTLVSACYHALSLRDSKRKFIRITTRVSPPVTWLKCQYDRFCLRGRWRKSPRVNGLIGRDWQRVQKTTLVPACYHALSLRDGKRKFTNNHSGISTCHVTPVSVWQNLWGNWGISPSTWKIMLICHWGISPSTWWAHV